MRRLFFSLLLIATAHGALAECTPSASGHEFELSRNMPTTAESPTCDSSIQLRPDPDARLAKAYLVPGTGEPDPRPLFTVRSHATLSWRADGKVIAVQDRFSYNVYKLLMFELSADPFDPEHAWLDGALRHAVEKRLPDAKAIVRYWPEVAQWWNDKAVVFVKFRAVSAAGETQPGCFTYLVTPKKIGGIQEVSAEELKLRLHIGCTAS